MRVGVGSGTDALILALRALGIGAGDEVITVSHTAVATVAAIIAHAAPRPFWSMLTLPITRSIRRASKRRSRRAARRSSPFISTGKPPTWTRSQRSANAAGLRIVEDCAQAAGGRYRGRRVGSLGDIACFSFYPTKNLGAHRRRRHGGHS